MCISYILATKINDITTVCVFLSLHQLTIHHNNYTHSAVQLANQNTTMSSITI